MSRNVCAHIVWDSMILNCDAIVFERCLFNKIKIRYPIFFDQDDLQELQFLMMSEDPQILTWLAKFIYYGFNKRNDIHWKAYVGSLHHSICWQCYIYIWIFTCRFMHCSFYQNFFLYVNSRNMYLIGMWRFAVVFLHMHLWCVLCSFYCFILWLLCQK